MSTVKNERLCMDYLMHLEANGTKVTDWRTTDKSIIFYYTNERGLRIKSVVFFKTLIKYMAKIQAPGLK